MEQRLRGTERDCVCVAWPCNGSEYTGQDRTGVRACVRACMRVCMRAWRETTVKTLNRAIQKKIYDHTTIQLVFGIASLKPATHEKYFSNSKYKNCIGQKSYPNPLGLLLLVLQHRKSLFSRREAIYTQKMVASICYATHPCNMRQ